MPKPKKLHLLLVTIMALASLLVACGDNTATTAPTTAAATTAAATTAAATTAAAKPTTAAATSAATTAVAATTAATTAAATTAATSSSPYSLPTIGALKDIPANAPKGGKFTAISLSKLAPELHPYPSSGNFTASWNDVAVLIHGAALATYNYTSLQWELDAAKDLKASSDNKTFTWTLRSDLKWSDGQPITVDDYQYGYDNAIKEDKENADANFVGLSDLQKITSMKSDKAAGTITMTLNDVYASDLALSYLTLVGPVPKHIWDGKPFYDATKNPEVLKPTVVSGPYMIESYDPNADGVFKPNPYWYRGKANFDQVILKSGSSAIAYEAVKSGQADWAYNIPPANYQQAKTDPNITLFEYNPINAGYRFIEYNTKRAPMSDKSFRQAINYAIDRTTLIKLAESGLGAPQFSFVNPASPYYNKEVNEYKFNLDTSKKLLTDAGYKLDGGKLLDKDGKPVEITVSYPISSKPRELIATYLQQQLKQLGISVKVDGKEFNAFIKQVYTAKDFDIDLGNQGGGFPDPDSYKSNIQTDGTQNASGYANPRIDDIFNQAGKEVDPAKRKVLYNEAQKTIADDSPVFFLYSLLEYKPMLKKIGGVTPSKGQRLDYNDVLTRWYNSTS